MEHTVKKESLEKTLSIVEGCFRKFGLRRLFGSFSARSHIVTEFALNLCVVAFGIRSGYLLDSFSPPGGEPCLNSLLEQLREISTPLGGLKLICAGDQFFIVNVSLLREKAEALIAKATSNPTASLDHPTSPTPLFVLLGPGITMTTPDPDLLHSISCISDTKESISLSSSLTPRTLVPLAGFLLDYPVCYVPASDDQTVYLSGVPLDVYNCVLINETANTPISHTLLKFTCPVTLGNQNSVLSHKSIMDALNTILISRLLLVSSPYSLKITHNTITLDRVAL